MWSEIENKERDQQNANVELVRLKAIKVLLTNNDLAAEIHISGLVAGVTLNERLQPIIDIEIDEVEKYLRGEPNNYG